MATPIIRKRKRSRAVGFTAIGALSMLAGCDSGPTEEELSRKQFGEPTEVSMFRSVSECMASGEFNKAQCDEAEKAAWGDDDTKAPRFESLTDCEDQFGNVNCQSHGSYFSPIMTGFIIGNLINGGARRYRYAGAYRDERNDRTYSGSGAWVHGNKSPSGRYLIGSKAFDAAPAKTLSRAAIASRGGFGGRASLSRGGGGGGSWGG